MGPGAPQKFTSITTWQPSLLDDNVKVLKCYLTIVVSIYLIKKIACLRMECILRSLEDKKASSYMGNHENIF